MIRSSRRDERGATAVLAITLAFVLLGVSAFTVDFGRAYLSKRQLQNAADAGALAAASHYATQSGECSTMTGGAVGIANKNAARGKAAAIIADSRPGSTTIAQFDVECLSGEVVVKVTLTGTTQVGLGGIYGVSSITTERAAEATTEVAPSVGRGLRPYMMCSRDIPNPVPSGVVKVEFAGQAANSTTCPSATNPGNWWTVNCPEDFSNSNAVLEENTRNGCEDPVSIVPNQPTPLPAPNPNVALRDALLAGCATGRDEDCLNAVTGNINGAGIWDAWNSLLGKPIVIPIFCGDPTCVPAAVVPAPGNNTNYPVHRFAAVTVCGYHWGAGPQTQGISTTGNCTGNTLNVTDGGNQDNYVLLAFDEIQVSGSTRDGTCSLGSQCDGGVRQVRLTK